MSTPEQRLAELGLELPPPPHPVASYVMAVRSGQLLHTAGHGPARPDGSYVLGKVGVELTVVEAAQAARLTGLNLLSTTRAALGSLDNVVRVVKVFGMVNCDGNFKQHPTVINGCSDLFIEVFGEAGRHARSAIGMVSLPAGIAVEIEAIFEVR